MTATPYRLTVPSPADPATYGAGAQMEPLLATPDVCARYRCDVRAARRVMHQAGAFEIAGKLWVRVADLDRLEREQTQASTETAARRTGRSRHSAASPRENLTDEFWRRFDRAGASP